MEKDTVKVEVENDEWKAADGSQQNPDFKSLKTKYGKGIRFTLDSILMTNNQGIYRFVPEI